MKIYQERLPNCLVKAKNGFYIVEGYWGTCFLKRTGSPKRQTEIKMFYRRLPNCFHTYTTYPASIQDNMWFVYCNYLADQSVAIHQLPGLRVVGFDQPQKSGEFLNRSFLIYCPSGEEPEVTIRDIESQGEHFFLENHETKELVPFGIRDMFRSRQIQVIRLNNDGYQARQPSEPSTIERSIKSDLKYQEFEPTNPARKRSRR